ncbi:MAG: CRISPR-associated endonuclease Cas2 [Deltaproteobacteria bacterium]|nr:MAG: CRISPR-associated endonuclease Cas2 [Deltaproteobacteria bacterium]
MEELKTFVFYDIPSDRIRNKVGSICKDYGLERIQFSGFAGSLNRNMREQFFLQLEALIGDHEAKVLILPVCEKDYMQRREIMNIGGEAEELDSPQRHRG